MGQGRPSRGARGDQSGDRVNGHLASLLGKSTGPDWDAILRDYFTRPDGTIDYGKTVRGHAVDGRPVVCPGEGCTVCSPAHEEGAVRRAAQQSFRVVGLWGREAGWDHRVGGEVEKWGPPDEIYATIRELAMAAGL